ncbi:hypothetical protein P170DRAFT_469853 [Aspergillus steynii IBT 23096]|uniref:RlpA-like protein double-psi beta-barrel domain-containing protein n=1 Tax=Aspergillus steynii IBT 23096 TaxID=1392250 RepID=A0A2I2GNE0_9EURO|nr:uncharacterized protein P170DRAFT_469853 [Aspergillus steynii IBT 23096]PLB54383.1 hypothetical protein P170DRAFT_469853 [Aspergillus steynii IBT 23096]
MAPLAKSLALAGSLLAAFGSAAPLNKRDSNNNVHVVYETATTVVWTTVDLTTTIYANIPAPTQPAPTTVVSVTQAAPTIQTQEPEPTPEPEPTTKEAQPTTTQVEEPEPTQPAVTSVAQPTYTPEPQPEPQQPTTTAVAQPTTTAAAQPAPTTGGGGSSSSSSSGSSSGGSWSSGDVTFYDTATSAGSPSSCGLTNDGSTENVVALSHAIMKDSDCGRTVTIEYNGKTTTGKVVDKCMGCNAGSIDLSRHMFLELASEAAGRLTNVKWQLN